MIRKKLFAAMTLAFSVSMVLAGCGSEKKQSRQMVIL